MRFGFVLLFALSAGCATAVEDGPVGVKHGDAATKDSLGEDDASITTDSGSDPDTTVDDSTVADSEEIDSSEIDSGEIDTGDLDTGPEFPDTDPPPPLDSGPTGGSCTWCSSGVCSDGYVDFTCWNDCFDLYGYFDCTYDPSASTPCMCHD
jgi:hypothetical protein